MEGSFKTSHETQYDDIRAMGRATEKEAWFTDGLRMGRIGGKGTICHTVVLGATCLTRGA